jgi:hypothetical protein
VLADAGTASAAGRGGRIALTVDGQPLTAHVIGVLARIPTVPAASAGFVVADEATLAGALDAQSPGQGAADELWLATRHTARLRAALRAAPFSQLTAAFRADVQRQLRSAPIARGVLGTLVAAALLSACLAILGLLVALLGAGRDERVERDLIAQGAGPRELRRELLLRLVLAAALGVAVGIALAALLTRLAVASVRAAGAVAAPQPPLLTVAPWGQLVLWAAVALAALAGASLMATRAAISREPAR